MKQLIIQIGLLIVGGFVFLLLFVVGFLYTTGKHIYKLDYSMSKQFMPIIRSITLLFDGLGNAGAGELLNDVYKVDGNIKYGKWYQTISAVTGLLLLHVKNIKLRLFLDKALGENHCTEAISEEDKYYYKNHIE
jgi:hypothetical protein